VRSTPARGLNAGFTLVEALVAVALMGLVMGALATVTAQWLPSWNRGLLRVQRNEQAAIALERLVADLSSAERVLANRDAQRQLFVGGELSVILVREAIGPNTKPGLEIVRIAETADALGRVLVRTRAPFAPLPIGDLSLDHIDFTDPVVLLRAPLRVTFSYPTRDGGWTSTWQDDVVPSAVRITVRDLVAERVLAVSTATRVHIEAPAPQLRPTTGTPDQGAAQMPQAGVGAGRGGG
jgi:general secretion pathway protein J